jgi:hypothetical protein
VRLTVPSVVHHLLRVAAECDEAGPQHLVPVDHVLHGGPERWPVQSAGQPEEQS